MIDAKWRSGAVIASLAFTAAAWLAIWESPMLFLALATFVAIAIALGSDQVWTHICAGVLLALLLAMIL